MTLTLPVSDENMKNSSCHWTIKADFITIQFIRPQTRVGVHFFPSLLVSLSISVSKHNLKETKKPNTHFNSHQISTYRREEHIISYLEQLWLTLKCATTSHVHPLQLSERLQAINAWFTSHLLLHKLKVSCNEVIIMLPVFLALGRLQSNSLKRLSEVEKPSAALLQEVMPSHFCVH